MNIWIEKIQHVRSNRHFSLSICKNLSRQNIDEKLCLRNNVNSFKAWWLTSFSSHIYIIVISIWNMQFRPAIFIWFVFAQFFKVNKNGDKSKAKSLVFPTRWKNYDFCRLYNERARALQSSITLFLYTLSSWEICLSMRQISLRERVEIAWFTRDI